MSAPRSTMPMRALITIDAALPAYCTATSRSGVVLVNLLRKRGRGSGVHPPLRGERGRGVWWVSEVAQVLELQAAWLELVVGAWWRVRVASQAPRATANVRAVWMGWGARGWSERAMRHAG